MIALVLILTVCHGAEPCRDVRVPTAQPIELPMHCAMAGQIEAAAWTQHHPGDRVIRWRCAREDERAA